MENISEHITYNEATKSATAIKYGIDNTPGEIELENMKQVAKEVFEPLRLHFNVPIAVVSFFRSKLLNKRIGGASSSQHCSGKAIDLDADVYNEITNKDIFEYIHNNLDFDQLIWEFGTEDNPDWVHVSYSSPNKNRKQALIAYKEALCCGMSKTKYKTYA